jgi:hypothetical protein
LRPSPFLIYLCFGSIWHVIFEVPAILSRPLPPIHDPDPYNVRDVPAADIGCLFDHLVGERKQLVGHRQAERFGGLEIDGESVLRGSLHTRRVAPGRLKLATSPSFTGSAPVAKTMGIVEVTFFAATAGGVFPTRTATGRRTSSATEAASCASRPAQQRYSSQVLPLDQSSALKALTEGSYKGKLARWMSRLRR